MKVSPVLEISIDLERGEMDHDGSLISISTKFGTRKIQKSIISGFTMLWKRARKVSLHDQQAEIEIWQFESKQENF